MEGATFIARAALSPTFDLLAYRRYATSDSVHTQDTVYGRDGRVRFCVLNDGATRAIAKGSSFPARVDRTASRMPPAHPRRTFSVGASVTSFKCAWEADRLAAVEMGGLVRTTLLTLKCKGVLSKWVG